MNELESKGTKQDTAKSTNANSVSLKAWLACTALPKPYYEDESVALFFDDCTRVLPLIPANSVDLVLTDPVYGIGEMVHGTMSKERVHKTKYDIVVDSPEYVENVCVPAIKICLKISPRTIVTPGFKCLKMYPQWDSFGTFYMPAATGMQLWGSGDNQPIIYYGRPYDIGKRIHKCSYTLIEPQSCTEHPCSKPIRAWSRIIDERSDIGHIILDPFCGSGTTLVAAKRLNRKAIGIEISEKYCEIAVNRLRQQELFSGAS
jgi:site-specific DNA-methyltransferase (adenine-specific)